MRMASMRAMVLSKLGPIEESPLKMTQIEKHEIKDPDEILLKIEACGVCRSQLHGIEGDWKDHRYHLDFPHLKRMNVCSGGILKSAGI